jgi:tellurite resistance protein
MKIETATIRRLRDALLKSGRRDTEVRSSAYEILTREGLLSAEETEAVDQVGPIAETMYLMMCADGTITDDERDTLVGAIRGLTGNLLQDGTINVMVERYQQAVRTHGRDARLQEIAHRLSDKRSDAESAFALAAAVALADDSVADAEREFITRLAEWLNITPERASAIVNEVQEDRAHHA